MSISGQSYSLTDAERAELARLERERQAIIALVASNGPKDAEAQQISQRELDKAVAQVAAEKLGVDTETAENAMQLARESVERVSRGVAGQSPFEQAQHQHAHASAPVARAPYTASAARLADLWNACNVNFAEQLAHMSSNINERFFMGTKIRPFALPESLRLEVDAEAQPFMARGQRPQFSDALKQKVKQFQSTSRALMMSSQLPTDRPSDKEVRDAVEKQRVIYLLICQMSVFETMLMRWATTDSGSDGGVVQVGEYAKSQLLPALRRFKETMGQYWSIPRATDHVDLEEVAPWLPEMNYETLLAVVESVFAPLADLAKSRV